MPSSGVTVGAVVSFTVVLLAIYYKKDDEDVLKNRLESVLSGLLRAEDKVHITNPPRVAVGFGACQDIFSNAIDVMVEINATASHRPEHFDSIADKEQFEKIFAYFFEHGAAAERYIEDTAFFRELVEAAERVGHRYALGGNAPVMAKRFLLEGCDVILGTTYSANLQGIPSDIKVVGEKLAEDDVHLLLEYRKGERWEHMEAPRANRFIVHNDQNNPKLKSMDEFAAEALDFNPSLVVVSGLQMMDSFPFKGGERESLLTELNSLLKKVPEETRVHFELASFAEEVCLADVIEHVVSMVDSIGMNEQELPNLHSMLVNNTITLISDPYPRIATTLDQMRSVYHILRSRSTPRPLTRLHVHTLVYQAIMVTKGSAWKNTMSAAAKASLTANRHVCGSDTIHTETSRILMDESFSTSAQQDKATRIQFNQERPVACWDEEDYTICIAPVLVCTDVVQTGGGGDNISSAGLVLQI